MKKLLLILLVGILVVGCGKKDIKVEGLPVEKETFDEFYKSFFVSLENNNTNEAIEKVTQALANDDFKEKHAELFRNLMILTLRAGRPEEAKKLLLDAMDNSPDYLNTGLGQICRYYATNSDTNNLLDWTAVLIDKKAPKEFMVTVYSWRMEALYRSDKLDDLFALVPVVISEVADENTVQIMSRYSNALLNKGLYDKQNELLELISSSAVGNNIIESFVLSSRINALAIQDNIKQAVLLFTENAKKIRDENISTSYNLLKDKLKATSGDTDQLTVFILENLKDKPRITKMATQEWVETVSVKKEYDLVITRINKLMDMGVDPNYILNVYLTQFYQVAGPEDKLLISKMMKTGDALMLVVDEKGKESIRALQLDGSFLLEDYARAAKCIEAGIEGRDEDWHKMALNKVNSHLALKEGRIEDAIAGFREFMEVIKGSKEGEVDPSTGLVYSKEMMLGQNYLRIAGLYKSIGKKKEAALAYEEAADYYTQALSAVKPDSKEYALIQKEIKKLPGGKGNNN